MNRIESCSDNFKGYMVLMHVIVYIGNWLIFFYIFPSNNYLLSLKKNILFKYFQNRISESDSDVKSDLTQNQFFIKIGFS